MTVFAVSPTHAVSTILYNQDFENPAAFVNNGGDINIFNSVNALYGNQPPGFTFTQAFGHGYSDPSNIGGNYALGMASGTNNTQNDLLGLSFDVGSNNFFNFSLSISSIDLSVFGGPVVIPSSEPKYEFTLFDNGVAGLGSGTILDSLQVSGTASARDVFDWTNVLLPLDATGNTNGNVILRIDLLNSGYAALDNFLIVASDTPGEIPIPATVWLFGTGIFGLLGLSRKKA